jgi:hypothetical protein
MPRAAPGSMWKRSLPASRRSSGSDPKFVRPRCETRSSLRAGRNLFRSPKRPPITEKYFKSII